MGNLLVIEDNEDIRETLVEILELTGYQITTAANGKEGYDSIVESCPDLVLCDVNMPEMGGFELLEAINDRLKNDVIPPFLFLTAKVEKQDILKGISLGADDYILKPFDSEELLTRINSKLAKRRQVESKAAHGERSRISADLHDSLQQMLVASLMGFNSLTSAMDLFNEREQDSFKKSLDHIKNAIEEIRKISKNVAQEGMANVSFEASIEKLINQVDGPDTPKLNFSYETDHKFSNDIVVELYRIVQECFSNILKHAQANEVSISFNEENGMFKLHIKDDGRGFDINESHKGFGLTNVTSRVEKINGDLKIESARGKGTSVHVEFEAS